MREATGIRITRNTHDVDILRVPAPIAERADVVHLLQKEIAATADVDLIPETTTIGITKGKKEDPAQELTIEEELRGRPRNAR